MTGDKIRFLLLQLVKIVAILHKKMSNKIYLLTGSLYNMTVYFLGMSRARSHSFSKESEHNQTTFLLHMNFLC